MGRGTKSFLKILERQLLLVFRQPTLLYQDHTFRFNQIKSLLFLTKKKILKRHKSKTSKKFRETETKKSQNPWIIWTNNIIRILKESNQKLMMKRCPKSVVIRKIQIKPQGSITSNPLRWL